MKGYRNIILLSVLILALGSVYFIINSTDDPAKTGMLYDYKDKTDIQEITIENEYGIFEFFNQDGKWLISSDGIYRTHQEKMDILIDNLLYFPVVRVLDDIKPEYGLSDPSIKVDFSTLDGNQHQLILGNTTSNGVDYYIKDSSTDNVMIASGDMVAQLTGSLAAYRDKEVLTIDKTSIRQISYYKKGELVVTTENTDFASWFLTYPYEAPARKIELNEFMVNMQNWKVAGYPEIGDNDMGLENPDSVIEITDGSGEMQRIELGTSDGTYTYARVGSIDDVVKLYTVDVDLSILDPDKLVFVAPMKDTIDEVKSISIKTQAIDTTFKIDNTTTTPIITSNGKPIDYNQFAVVFSKYISINACGRDPKKTDTSEPIAILTTEKIDGEIKQLKLFLRDNDTLYMLVDDKTEYYVESDILEQLIYRVENAVK